MVDDVLADAPAQAPHPAAGSPRRVPAGWALGLALLAGGALLIAFPPIGQWWAAPVGVALLAIATHRRGFWSGVGLGLLTGLTLLVPLLSWAGGFIGPVWLLLPAIEAAYVGLLGGLSALASPVVDRWRWTWPVVTGTLWVLQEALRDRTPFGGFPWGRLAFSQADSPLIRLAAAGGAPLVTFGVATVGGLLGYAALRVGPPLLHQTGRRSEWPELWRDPALRSVALPALVAVLALLVPLAASVASFGGSAEPAVRVAIVQGNVPRLGLEFNAQRRAVLDNHVNATLALAASVAAGRTPRPDLVVWPENASDIDPIANSDARYRIDQAATAIGVPILVGGLLNGPGKGARNVALVWQPGQGPTQMYIKRHPVPFAEYIPLRSLAKKFTDKVDLVRSDFVAGPTPGVLRVGPATVGDVICFEVAYDNVVRDTVTSGADLLVVQTNNATFTVAEARQQLAMVRLRAVEHGRPALMASTVGVSAFVTPDGAVHDASHFNTPATLVGELHLRSARTIATELGALPEAVLVIVALGTLVAAVILRGARRSATSPAARPLSRGKAVQ
jgi:apolipoprotein N-acyltransferase